MSYAATGPLSHRWGGEVLQRTAKRRQQKVSQELNGLLGRLREQGMPQSRLIDVLIPCLPNAGHNHPERVLWSHEYDFKSDTTPMPGERLCVGRTVWGWLLENILQETPKTDPLLPAAFTEEARLYGEFSQYPVHGTLAVRQGMEVPLDAAIGGRVAQRLERMF